MASADLFLAVQSGGAGFFCHGRLFSFQKVREWKDGKRQGDRERILYQNPEAGAYLVGGLPSGGYLYLVLQHV